MWKRGTEKQLKLVTRSPLPGGWGTPPTLISPLPGQARPACSEFRRRELDEGKGDRGMVESVIEHSRLWPLTLGQGG